MEIIIEALDAQFNKLIPFLIKAVRLTAAFLGLKKRSIEIVLLKRGFNKNVWSFSQPKSFPAPDKKQKSLGIIYLNPDFIKKSGDDIVYMLIHGILHLLGYDHKVKNDIIKMKKEEDRIMKYLNKHLK